MKMGIISLVIGFIAALLLTFTQIWQLVIIGGILAGLLAPLPRGWVAFISGMLSVMLAWLVLCIYFIITQPVLDLFDIVFQLIVGSPGLGILALVLTLIIGGVVGGFGGSFGFLIRTILKPPQSKVQ